MSKTKIREQGSSESKWVRTVQNECLKSKNISVQVQDTQSAVPEADECSGTGAD